MQRLIMALVLALALSVSNSCRAVELSELEWLSGHWFSDDKAYEEVWIAPKAGSMSGSFRWVFANGKQILEYLVIEEKDEQIFLRFKHFETDYVPWEKGEPNLYKLESLKDRQVTFTRRSKNSNVPLKLVYRRDTNRLYFTGFGDAGEEPLELAFVLGK